MNKSNIFKRAHELRRVEGLNMSQALTQAWDEAKIFSMDFDMFNIGAIETPKHKEISEINPAFITDIKQAFYSLGY